MEKEILIDASQEKQTRIAIKSDNGVEAYEYENEQKKQLKGNIYLGKISRIEPSLQAAFETLETNVMASWLLTTYKLNIIKSLLQIKSQF